VYISLHFPAVYLSNKEINGNWCVFLQQWIGKYRKAYSVGYIESNWSPSKMNGIDLYLFWKYLTSIPLNGTCVRLHWIEMISTSIYWNRFQFRSEWSWFIFPVNGTDIYPDSMELISIPIEWNWYLPCFNWADLYSHCMELISTLIQWSWFLFPVNGPDIYPDSMELISIPSECYWYLPWYNGAQIYFPRMELISIRTQRNGSLSPKYGVDIFPYSRVLNSIRNFMSRSVK